MSVLKAVLVFMFVLQSNPYVSVFLKPSRTNSAPCCNMMRPILYYFLVPLMSEALAVSMIYMDFWYAPTCICLCIWPSTFCHLSDYWCGVRYGRSHAQPIADTRNLTVIRAFLSYRKYAKTINRLDMMIIIMNLKPRRLCWSLHLWIWPESVWMIV
jgi:hypothetical protein